MKKNDAIKKTKKDGGKDIKTGKGLFKLSYQLDESILIKAGIGDSDAECEIGEILLQHGRTNLARGFFKLAAIKGHPRARDYLKKLD